MKPKKKKINGITGICDGEEREVASNDRDKPQIDHNLSKGIKKIRKPQE